MKAEVKTFIEAFEDLGRERGDLVTHAELRDVLGFPATQPKDAVGYQKDQLKWMSAFARFREELLEHRSIMLHSVRGDGYRIVPANEQTGLSLHKMAKRVATALDRGATELRCVDRQQLSGEEVEANNQAQIRVQFIRNGASRMLNLNSKMQLGAVQGSLTG